MTQHRVARKTTRQKPAWDAQARDAARGLGVSEAKVTQQVEAELIRLVAEEIAKQEFTRLRAQHRDSGENAPQPSIEFEKTVRREKVWMPPKKDD